MYFTTEGTQEGRVMGGSEPCLAWCSLSLDNHTSDTSDCGEVHGTNTVPTLTPTTACCLPALVLSSMLCLTSVYIISPPLLLLHYSMSHETKWLRCVLWFIKQNCNNSRNKVTKLTIFAWFRYLKLFRSRHLQAKTRHHISTSTEFQIQLALWRRKSISVKWKVKRDWMQIMN